MISVDMNNKTQKIHVVFFPSKEKRVVKLEGKTTGVELLKHLNLHLDAHILVRDITPIPIDEELNNGDEIQILTVASGG